MLVSIGFEELQVGCIIGTEPHEREREQRLLVDLSVEMDLAPAAASGLLADTVDYVALAALSTQMAQEGRYALVEQYIADLARAVLDAFAVASVSIRVRKPAALEQAACAFLTLRLERR